MLKKILLLTGCMLAAGGIVFTFTRNPDRRLIPDIEKKIENKKNLEPLVMLKTPFILVKKKERKLYLFDDEKLIKDFGMRRA